MAIEDLKPRQGKIDLTAEVIDIGETRTFQKFGNQGRVANAKIRDATGEITLSLWNEQIDQVKVGDKVHITNGYVSEWQGEKQLTTGKFGKLEVIGSSTKTGEAEEEPAEEKPRTNAPPEETEETGENLEEEAGADEEEIE